MKILSIILLAAGAVSIFAGGRAYLRKSRWSRVVIFFMPIGLVVAAVGILLFFIPDFFSAK